MSFERFRPYFADILQVKWTLLGSIIAGILAAVASGFGLPFMIDKVLPAIFNQTYPQGLLDYLAGFGYSGDRLDQVALVSACLFMPSVFVIRGIGSFFNVYWLQSAGFRILENIRLRVFSRLQFLPLAFHEKHKRGDLLARVNGDTTNLQAALTQVANDMVIQPLTLLGAVGFLVYKSIEQTNVVFLLITLFSVAVVILPIWYLGKKMIKRARQLQAQSGNVSAVIQENLAAQRDIRAYQLENIQIGLLRESIRILFRMNLKVIKTRQLLTPVIEVVTALGISIALYISKTEGMQLSNFIALITALYMCYDPVKKLGVVHNRVKQAEASLERLEEIIDYPDTIAEPAAPKPLPAQTSGQIDFRGLSFSYVPGEPILSGIDAHIPAGQVVALVGPSGAGKTTFASLLPRFYDPAEGSVQLDGIDLRDVTLKDLRARIALVTQHPILFRATIRENIRLGRPGASDEEVELAARRAAAHDFITDFPAGYDTMIGEGGEGISGGQRQRLAIARAFLKDAPILVLDEATAALDAESEAKIQAQLADLVRGRTTFIIAHRFSTIQIAQRILFFEKGKITGDGSHDELFASHAMYRQFCLRQGIQA